MKQLKKLKLNEFHEMTDNEMKFIVGGSGSGSGSGWDDPCAGKETTIKCTIPDPEDPDGPGKEEIIRYSVGCPESNLCPAGQYMSCACF